MSFVNGHGKSELKWDWFKNVHFSNFCDVVKRVFESAVPPFVVASVMRTHVRSDRNDDDCVG